MKSNISSDMNMPCWKLVKACPQSQKLFCFGENNLLRHRTFRDEMVMISGIAMKCRSHHTSDTTIKDIRITK